MSRIIPRDRPIPPNEPAETKKSEDTAKSTVKMRAGGPGPKGNADLLHKAQEIPPEEKGFFRKGTSSGIASGV